MMQIQCSCICNMFSDKIMSGLSDCVYSQVTEYWIIVNNVVEVEDSYDAYLAYKVVQSFVTCNQKFIKTTLQTKKVTIKLFLSTSIFLLYTN